MEPSPQAPDSPVWQCGGRVLVGGVDKGAGVAVGPRHVLTAGHVVGGGQEGMPVSFKPLARDAVPVTPPIRLAERLDAAALDLADAVAWSPVSNAREGERWFVNATGASNDPVLTGAITAIGVPITDAMGNRVTAIQLLADQDLGGFKGYSGGAVVNEQGQVTGLLIEQKPQRIPVRRPAASNVLFALPIADVAESLRIDVSLALPAPILKDVSRSPEGPSSPLPTTNVSVEVKFVSTAESFAPPIQTQPSPLGPPVEAMQPQPLVEPALQAPTLSAGLRRIIGRREEIRSVAGLLRRGDRRLVTLWGPPGVGKSRLSIAIAGRLANSFQKRIWNVKLEAVPARAETRLVVQHVMEKLRMPDVQSEDMLDVLSRSLGQRPAVLILDNCEHVTGAVAEIAEWLLTAVGELRVLATSQNPLGVEGEFVLEVNPLDLDDAMLLFMDLAWEGRPCPAQMPDVVIRDICEKVDRIPLAIRLAAARVRDGVAISEVRDGLDRSLRVLVDSPQFSNPRHRAMETALDWSYGLLDEDGQRMLRVASIFAAPFDRQAAGYLFGESKTGLGSKTDIVLRTLKGRALIQAEEGWHTWLETIRQYGEKKLRQSGEATSVNERFAHYFLEMAETADNNAHGREELYWLACLEANRDHLRGALAILAKRPQDVELRLRLAVALENFWRRRGYLEWGSDELHQVLACSQEHRHLRALALIAAGRIAGRRGDLGDASTLLDEALTIATTVHDMGLEASALEAKGFLMHEAGENAAARPRLEEALQKARAAGLRWLERAVLNDLGLVARSLQQFPEAERFFAESHQIAQELGDVIAKGAVLSNVGLIRMDQDDYAGARGAFESALQVLTDAGEVYAVVIIRLNLSRVAVFERRYDDASAILKEGLAEAQRIGARGVVAWAQDLTGWMEETRALYTLPELPEEERRAALTSALDNYAHALDIYLELCDGWRAAWVLESAGWVAGYLSDHEKELRYFQEAAGLYRQAGRESDAQRIDSVIGGSVIAGTAATEPPEALRPPSEGLLRLEAALESDERDRGLVREAIRGTEVYALGQQVNELGEAPSSDLLHFTIDSDDGTELTMLPIFTRADTMRTALLRNPEWQEFSVLEINGRALLDNIDTDVNVVVNPWTPAEFVLECGQD